MTRPTTTGKAQDLITFTRSTTGTYLGSDGLLKSAAIDEARIEYDASGNCLGLLVEEARTNLCLFSESFTSTWVHNNSTLNSGIDSPNGGNNAWSITENTSTSTHQVYYPSLINSTGSGQSFNFSVYVKQLVGNRRIQIAFTGSAFGSEAYATFNINSKAIFTNASMDGQATIKPVGNGWYKVSASATTNQAAAGSVVLRMWNADNTGYALYAGDGVSTLGIYGAQFETGSFPTSYIPTSGSTVTRAKDIASLAVSEFGYNQDQGSVVVEFDHNDLNDDVSQYLLSSTSSSRFIYNNLNSQNWQAFDGQSGLPFGNVLGNGLPVKLGLGMGSSESSSINNGVIQNTTNATPQDNAGSLLYFGLRYNGANSLNGHIKSVQYYPLRLSNAQLQALTV